MAKVTAVCVVHAVHAGYYHDTEIDKRPRRGRVRVDPDGLAGDTQVDSSHGGRDAAVYVYADEDAADTVPQPRAAGRAGAAAPRRRR